jgi:nucleotide-binding universal stress UspA family protein
MAFHKILCPVDFSDGSREALRVAAERARELSASLLLVHIWQSPVAGEFQFAPAAMHRMVDAEQAELASWKVLATELGAREVEARFVTGTPWDQIVKIAQGDQAIDLVVMATHGRTGLAHALLGSVTEKVVRHAPCAVLVVRPQAHRG